MTARRLSSGGEIDRSRPLTFTFDGQTIEGFEGDTLASALLASGPRVLGRSFKYRRPRGLYGAGVEEPNISVSYHDAAGAQINLRPTMQPARDGLALRSDNTDPDAAHDRHALIDRFSRFLPAGFYYKTFMWPNWHLFEPKIRAMAGLGTVDPALTGPVAEQVNHWCDTLVIGAGPAGLAAALTLARAGEDVMLIDDGSRPGGSLLWREGRIDGKDGATWLADTLAELNRLRVRVMPRTTAFGIYDHGLVALNQRHDDGAPDTLWRVRPTRTILATGAIDRPLPFDGNDRPGIMSAHAGLTYLRRYAVLPGQRITVACNNSTGAEVASAMAQAGAEVTLVDGRPDAAPVAGVHDRPGRIASAPGRGAVSEVVLEDGSAIACDCVLVSGGFTPTIHLYAQAQGKLGWDADQLAFVPRTEVTGLTPVGAAAGHFTLGATFAHLGSTLGQAPQAEETRPYAITPAWPDPQAKGRIWIDYQHDVTTKDVALAAREGFTSVEHLKRYTTLGMATDQGKTSNIAGLALMGALTGRDIPQVGTTTYRPPFTPVPLASLGGLETEQRMAPLRRLTLEPAHRAAGATFGDYGGWLRPACYGAATEADQPARIQSEAATARDSVALFDGTPLGKIEVIGPDAAEFLDFIYYNTVSTLKPGRCRYGFILSEAGIVFDDGVLVRQDENRFLVSCSSSHTAGVLALLEEWRQDRFPRAQVHIHNATAETCTLTVTGPRARDVLLAAGVTCDDGLSDEALPHMAMAWGSWQGQDLRVTRVSFTGDRSYEISIRADQAEALWETLHTEARRLGGGLLGVEALQILRAEKGFIMIGKDTDGLTRPMDLGMTGPLMRKKTEFLGRRSLWQEEAQRPDRKQFVGLEPADGAGILPCGAHGIDTSGARPRSLGYVTSSYHSPTLGRPIALALIERGAERIGEVIEIQHLGQRRRARLTAPCAFDPKGDRLHA